MGRTVKTMCFALVMILLFSEIAYSTPLPKINAQGAVLMDAKTGQVIYEKNMHIRYAPASTTKIMTAILAIESGHLDDDVKVSMQAASTPGSSMHLYAGQILTLRELVTGLLLRSGNDAAVAIAEYLAGSIGNFAELMNQKADLIGAHNTHFVNPHGLTKPGHYSSAFDLAWIARYALTNPIFAEIVNTRETSIEWMDRSGRGQDRNLRNTNKLLWMLEEADGVKTGTTNAAGPCLVSSATRGNHKLIAVVLHDHNRWHNSMQLLKYGFDNYELYEYASRGDVMGCVPVERGLEKSIDVYVASPAALLVEAKDYANVKTEIDLPEKINAPVYQGQKIGEIVFYIGERAVKTVDLVAEKDIEERTSSKIFFQHLLHIFKLLSNWGLL
jgi:D-alanyl-D-alanine carboxypeptidase (penicillin-binding protein 5/6)